jgi:hypothetical protein
MDEGSYLTGTLCRQSQQASHTLDRGGGILFRQMSANSRSLGTYPSIRGSFGYIWRIAISKRSTVFTAQSATTLCISGSRTVGFLSTAIALRIRAALFSSTPPSHPLLQDSQSASFRTTLSALIGRPIWRRVGFGCSLALTVTGPGILNALRAHLGMTCSMFRGVSVDPSQPDPGASPSHTAPRDLVAEVDRDYVRALLGQPDRVTAPLTPRRPGNERDLALNSSSHLLLVLSWWARSHGSCRVHSSSRQRRRRPVISSCYWVAGGPTDRPLGSAACRRRSACSTGPPRPASPCRARQASAAPVR